MSSEEYHVNSEPLLDAAMERYGRAVGFAPVKRPQGNVHKAYGRRKRLDYHCGSGGQENRKYKCSFFVVYRVCEDPVPVKPTETAYAPLRYHRDDSHAGVCTDHSGHELLTPDEVAILPMFTELASDVQERIKDRISELKRTNLLFSTRHIAFIVQQEFGNTDMQAAVIVTQRQVQNMGRLTAQEKECDAHNLVTALEERKQNEVLFDYRVREVTTSDGGKQFAGAMWVTRHNRFMMKAYGGLGMVDTTHGTTVSDFVGGHFATVDGWNLTQPTAGFFIPKEDNPSVDWLFTSYNDVHAASLQETPIRQFGSDAGPALQGMSRRHFPDAVKYVCQAKPHLPSNIAAAKRKFRLSEEILKTDMYRWYLLTRKTCPLSVEDLPRDFIAHCSRFDPGFNLDQADHEIFLSYCAPAIKIRPSWDAFNEAVRQQAQKIEQTASTVFQEAERKHGNPMENRAYFKEKYGQCPMFMLRLKRQEFDCNCATCSRCVRYCTWLYVVNNERCDV